MAVNGIQRNDLAKAKQVLSDGYFYSLGNAVSQPSSGEPRTAPITQQQPPALCPPSWLLLCWASAKEAGSWSLPALFFTDKTKSGWQKLKIALWCLMPSPACSRRSLGHGDWGDQRVSWIKRSNVRSHRRTHQVHRLMVDELFQDPGTQ